MKQMSSLSFLSFSQNTRDMGADDIYSVANARWLKVLSVDRSNTISLTHLVLNYISSNNYYKAKRYLRAMSKLGFEGDKSKYYELKAKLYWAQGILDKSIENWIKSVDHGGVSEKSYYNIGNQYFLLNNTSKAKEYSEKSLIENHSFEPSLLLSAKCLMQELRWHEAIEILKEYDGFIHNRATAISMLFDCYTHSYDYTSAHHLARVVRDTNSCLHHFFEGRIHFNEHRHSDAEESFRTAISLEKNHLPSKVWLTRCLCTTRDHSKAELFTSEILREGNSGLFTIARCWDAAGVFDKAEQYYKAYSESQCSIESYLPLIRFYYSNRDWGKAYFTITKAKKRGTNSPIIDQILKKIEIAAKLAKIRLPKNYFSLSACEFFSSEEMVKSIVNKCLLNTGPLSQKFKTDQSGKNRIMILIGSLGPGGAERQAVNLANGLLSNNKASSISLSCTHLSRTSQDRFYEPFVEDGVDIFEYYNNHEIVSPYSIPELAEYAELIDMIQPLSRQQLILHMARHVIERKPDVVHGWLDETFINTALVCNMLNIPSIVGRWGSMPPGMGRRTNQKERHNIKYLLRAYREIGRFKNLKYISNSRMTADAYADVLNISREDVSIVYNGVDKASLDYCTTELRNKRHSLGIHDEDQIVGTIFRISEEKRPFLWVDTAIKVLEKHPNIHFIIVGAGPFEDQLAEYIEKQSVNNIHMVGKQSNVGLWYSLFDVLLLTSRVEGVSNTVIEGQLCGCPVIAPDVGGLPEAVDDGRSGYLLSDHSVDSFAAAVVKLLDDSELRIKFGKYAKIFASEKFSIDRLVGKTAEIYIS